MKSCFKQGDYKEFNQVVAINDIAIFDSGKVHNVLSTFSIAKYAEWVCRLFVIDLIDDDEEGIGIFLEIGHKSPAFVGDLVIYTGIFEVQKGNKIICRFTAKVGNRVIATGLTGQKILKKEKINNLFKSISGEGQ